MQTHSLSTCGISSHDSQAPLYAAPCYKSRSLGLIFQEPRNYHDGVGKFWEGKYAVKVDDGGGLLMKRKDFRCVGRR